MIDNVTMRKLKEHFDLALDEWIWFRQAHLVCNSQPTVVDPEKFFNKVVQHLTQRQQRQTSGVIDENERGLQGKVEARREPH